MPRRFDRVLVTGGAGYVGSLLIPQLLERGYAVTVYDTLYFGKDFLPLDNPNLSVVKGDIREVERFSEACQGVDAIINLACISNDASFELDEALSTSINLEAFEPMVVAAKAAGVKRFIYASTSSVYGVSDAPEVKEDHPLVPLTSTTNTKACVSRCCSGTSRTTSSVTIRPATVCGYAAATPRTCRSTS